MYLNVHNDFISAFLKGLFKSLFSVGGFSLDREELFGETNSGKASKGVAKVFVRVSD